MHISLYISKDIPNKNVKHNNTNPSLLHIEMSMGIQSVDFPLFGIFSKHLYVIKRRLVTQPTVLYIVKA